MAMVIASPPVQSQWPWGFMSASRTPLVTNIDIDIDIDIDNSNPPSAVQLPTEALIGSLQHNERSSDPLTLCACIHSRKNIKITELLPPTVRSNCEAGRPLSGFCQIHK